MNIYTKNLKEYSRRESVEVTIGDIPLGGDHPIRIQSMTVSDTMDTVRAVEECKRIFDAGAEYVRLTAPSIREAENLKNIKESLVKNGYKKPLIADIHFTPNAALAAVGIVEKVRINPGNFADRKRFQSIEYTDRSYNEEIERIHERFSPLVLKCKNYGTAMRIGTNHGSLSDRILSRYGDTPLGMVESALEFIRICEDHQYYNIVLSMKASNPIVMIQAYRLLVSRMDTEHKPYPLHLGVTEAGEGEDGRIKSAIGIGALLDDGIGDTIRVSLTEPPEHEIPVAQTILKRYELFEEANSTAEEESVPINPFEFKKRDTIQVDAFGGREVPRVIIDVSTSTSLGNTGHRYDDGLDKWHTSDTIADYLYLGTGNPVLDKLPEVGLIYDYEMWKKQDLIQDRYPLFTYNEIKNSNERSEKLNFVTINVDNKDREIFRDAKNIVIILEGSQENSLTDYREFIFDLIRNNIDLPVIIRRTRSDRTQDDNLINSSIDIGGLLIDGLGDGFWLEDETPPSIKTMYNILQAARSRISKTEYISCPSCGRTLFDLETTSAKIRNQTSHLKGVKIGIMGCIVNGPGEMADADYGYVGTGVGRISLYRGQEVIEKNIPEENAVGALIELIKGDGNWIDPH